MPERDCPQCTARMGVARRGALELDICGRCGGVWFDHGELTQVAQAGAEVIRGLCARLEAAMGGSAPPPWRAPPGTAPAPAGPTPGGAATRRQPHAADVPEGPRCPSCGQSNAEKASVCWACGALLRKVVVGECPHCRGELHQITWQDV